MHIFNFKFPHTYKLSYIKENCSENKTKKKSNWDLLTSLESIQIELNRGVKKKKSESVNSAFFNVNSFFVVAFLSRSTQFRDLNSLMFNSYIQLTDTKKWDEKVIN